ncbi:ABC transporter substrate-binding protein [Microlunatus speluncae]|uniref:ABC transporter substrate-binding protein n=1 Tax=Microlunatus speluncae TaxID=2594267 RepID=UPI0012662124|nr:ABC transporter substrate-binding protein [Microlunatus speluncae]
MKLQRTVVAGLAAFLLALTGCTTGSTVTEGGGDQGGGDKKSIALISKGFQHQFWQAVKQGAQEKADELGYKLTFDGPAAETEVDAQLQMFQTAIDRKPGAIGFAALDPKACIPLMDAAKQAGIPVVEFDAGCDSDVPLNISKTDSMAAGAIAADHLAELIGGTGKIAIVAHSQVNSTAVERRDGFINRMKEKYPEIQIIDTQYGDGDHLKSSDIAKSLIAANPDLKGLYGTNEGSAIGIVNAVGELNLAPGKITIVGFDSGKAQIDAIKTGVMAGAITQDPIGIGRATVESAVKAIEGQQVEKVIDTGSYWYDKTNIDDPKIAAVLYQ